MSFPQISTIGLFEVNEVVMSVGKRRARTSAAICSLFTFEASPPNILLLEKIKFSEKCTSNRRHE